jgi:flagellar protein FliL
MADKDDEEKGKEEGKKGGKGKIMMLLPTILLLAAAGWYFFLRSDGPAEVVLPTPTAGSIKALDPITVNLAGGHFLKLGMAVQFDASAGEETDGSKALDLAITEFSGRTIDELATTTGRDKAKEELVARLKLAYMPETPDAETALQTAMKDAIDQAPAAESGSGTTSAAAASSTDNVEGVTPKKTVKKKASTAASTTEDAIDPSSLTPEQAILASENLTVLPAAYELYFTEFVMQ